MIKMTRYNKPHGNTPVWDYVCDTRAEAENGMPEDAPVGSTVQAGEDGSMWRKFPTIGWKELPKNTTGAAAVLMCGGKYLQA